MLLLTTCHSGFNTGCSRLNVIAVLNIPWDRVLHCANVSYWNTNICCQCRQGEIGERDNHKFELYETYGTFNLLRRLTCQIHHLSQRNTRHHQFFTNPTSTMNISQSKPSKYYKNLKMYACHFIQLHCANLFYFNFGLKIFSIEQVTSLI